MVYQGTIDGEVAVELEPVVRTSRPFEGDDDAYSFIRAATANGAGDLLVYGSRSIVVDGLFSSYTAQTLYPAGGEEPFDLATGLEQAPGEVEGVTLRGFVDIQMNEARDTVFNAETTNATGANDISGCLLYTSDAADE